MSDPEDFQADWGHHEVLKRLLPVQAAVFRFVEKMHELEETPQEERKPVTTITWG